MSLFTSGVSSSVWERKRKEIDASTASAVDEIELSKFKGIKYIMCISKGTDAVLFDMNVINKNGIVKETVYGKIGSGISYDLDTATNLGTMSLIVTNNEAAKIGVELIKCKFS